MMRRTGTARSRRSGFTMIEMLVVVMIIGLLVGLLIPAVIKVQDAVKRSKVNWQMTQITTAADQFCASESMGKVGYLPQAPFQLKPIYNVNETEAIYLKQVFPNLPPGPSAGTISTGLPTATLVDGNEVAMFFLTGGEITQYSGFATNSQQPFLPAAATGEIRKGPFVQLQADMYEVTAAGTRARFIDPYRQPYAIFMGRNGSYGTQTFTSPVTSTTVAPYYRGTPPKQKYENPKGIQIISAGQDKRFGIGGDWNARVEDKDTMDDLSNFSTTGLGYGPP